MYSWLFTRSSCTSCLDMCAEPGGVLMALYTFKLHVLPRYVCGARWCTHGSLHVQAARPASICVRSPVVYSWLFTRSSCTSCLDMCAEPGGVLMALYTFKLHVLPRYVCGARWCCHGSLHVQAARPASICVRSPVVLSWLFTRSSCTSCLDLLIATLPRTDVQLKRRRTRRRSGRRFDRFSTAIPHLQYSRRFLSVVSPACQGSQPGSKW